MRLSYNNTALGLISGLNPPTTHHEHDNYKHEQKQEEEEEKEDIFPTLFCPSCGYHLQSQLQGGIQNWMGLPAGVKFDPTDNEIIEHLEAKVKNDSNKLHSLIDQFIPTLEGDNGICYTHPENLPGVRKDGKIKHFFHRPSKAYTTGKRKRRKVERTEEEDGNNETRWHKTGKTRPIFVGSRGVVKGFKKILVLYTNYGRRKKPEKTNWVMHQYHLGVSEEEKDGEFVISKVFFQKQPRHSGSSNQIMMKDSSDQNISKTPTVDIIDYYNPSFININTGTSQSKQPETETQKQEQLLITNNETKNN